MKHTIDIKGLPENIEIESAEICTDITRVYDGMYIGVILETKIKKKQPRRIILDETEYHNIPDGADQSLWHSIGNKWWRIVEDSGENDD